MFYRLYCFSKWWNWYKNDGQQNFTEIVIDSNVRIRGCQRFRWGWRYRCHFSGKTVSYENNGTGIFSKHAVTTVDNGAACFRLGYQSRWLSDILVASVSDQTISGYENNGSGGLAQRIVTSSASGVKDIRAVDLDQDGDIDVISACISSDSSIT